MSAVATKEESLLNIAQVTESLWPVDNKKERKKKSVITQDWKTIDSYELQKTQRK